eukprot:SAG22_NODE_1834_length_3469_cov_1.557864_3_plen_379_part_00
MRPWHSLSALDYAVSANSPLVKTHGFQGSFDPSTIGLSAGFPFDMNQYKRRSAFHIIQAERYDRTRNLWTAEAQGLGTSPGHFGGDVFATVPPGSWARYDGVDFGRGGDHLGVRVYARSANDGATVNFYVNSPVVADSAVLVASVLIAAPPPPPKVLRPGGLTGPQQTLPGFSYFNSTTTGSPTPKGIHSVFMVFEAATHLASTPPRKGNMDAPPPPPVHGIGATIDWFSFTRSTGSFKTDDEGLSTSSGSSSSSSSSSSSTYMHAGKNGTATGPMPALRTLDWIVMCGHLVFCALVGIAAACKAPASGKSASDDYFLAGRSQNCCMVGISLLSGLTSGISLLGSPGWGYHDGIGASIVSIYNPDVCFMQSSPDLINN